MISGGPVTGGTYVICSVCKRRSKKKGGMAWYRRHHRRTPRCWQWEITYL